MKDDKNIETNPVSEWTINNYTDCTFNKEYITELKNSGNGDLGCLIKKLKDNRSIVFILENLGHLPQNFDGSFLIPLLNHEYSKIRLLAAKNIAKLTNFDNTAILLQTYQNETDTGVRREIVSAIGRMRNPHNKTILFNLLQDNDPKIVCQAIRGLLVFENDSEVIEKLKPLINHPNEMVRTVIYKEFFSTNKTNQAKLPHPESYDYLKNIVVNNDVLQVLKYVPDESIHLTFTSPPYYNARDYSIYLSYKETHRITKDGRFLIVNTSLFPVELCRRVIQYYSFKGDLVFDPFAGSGTVGRAAKI